MDPESNLQLDLATLQQRLTTGQPIYANEFSIESFGAVGDGTTDCTAAFSAAWTALQNAGGGSLVFGAGRTYLVNPTINTNWLSLTTVPVNLAFNGCTVKVGNTFTANSGNYIVLFLFYGCSPIRIGTVTILSQVMMAINQSNPDQTGIIAFDFLSTNTVGCVNVFAEPIYQTGGKACVEVFRNANGSGVVNPQPVSARSSGMVFTLINTSGVYYPLQLQHSGDAVVANIVDVLCFRPFFVFGVRQVHLNVLDTNHMGSAVIAAYNETSVGGWNDDPNTRDIDVDYKCLAATGVRATFGTNVLIEAQGPNPCYFSNLRIREDVSNNPSHPEGVLIAFAKYNNGAADETGSRGHILDNIDFSAHVDNAQAQTDLLSFFDQDAGVGNIGLWTGETINNLHIHDVSVLGSASCSMDLYLAPIYGAILENIQFSGVLTLSGAPPAISGVALRNCVFNGSIASAASIAGQIGSQLVITVPFGSAVSLSSSVVANLGNFALTTGTWRLEGQFGYGFGSGVTETAHFCGFSTANNSFTGITGGTLGGTEANITQSQVYAPSLNVPAPTVYITVATTQTIYMNTLSYFSGGADTMVGFGLCTATRIY